MTWTSRLKTWTDAEWLRQHEDKVLLTLTLIIGAAVGLVIVAFILLTEDLGALMYPVGSAAWRRVLIPVLGSMVTGFLLRRYFPNARGSGIPQTKAALFIHGGYIRLRTVLGKFCCSAVSLASGIALGREGPSVHLGAGIASVLGRRLGLGPSRVQALVPVGVSAALAAAFNTPIAAVLFTLEEVMGDLHTPVLGSIVLSSATSWIVLRLLLGDEPLFHVAAYQFVHPVELVVYAFLGVAGGLVSVCFVRLLLWLRRQFLRMPQCSEWLQPAAGGLLVGLLGWFVPEVLGVGYGHVGRALNGQVAVHVMVLLVVLKLLATATCYASGNAGGIFGPSLFIGAMLGGAIGSGAHQLLPDYTGSVGAYALVGMGTAFAGIIRVRLTSVIMIFEITRDYSVIVPLMISNLVSYFISQRLQREPIYEALQRQDGIHLPPGGGSRRELLLVSQAMRAATEVLPADAKAADHRAAPADREQNAWPVMGNAGLLGMITVAQLETAVAEGGGDRTLADLLPVADPKAPLTAEHSPHVHADHPLDTVLRRMAETGLNILPVVSRANLRELVGVVSLRSVLEAYGVGEEKSQPPQPAAQETSAAGTLVTILGVVLGALILAGLLAYSYRAERRTRAEESFQAGNELARQGRDQEAIERYRNALSVSHSSEHRLALGLALVRVGRLNEAAIYLQELLKVDPTGGAASLGMARIAAGEGRVSDAVTYYHRAVYGSWPVQPNENRIQVRFELAGVLGKSGARKQASAELLSLLEEVPHDLAPRKKVGLLLLEFGSPRESAEVFREVLRKDPQDGDAYAGLGQAEFAEGNYLAAQQAFRSALQWNAADKTSRERLQVCEQIADLDPTLRGLCSWKGRRSEIIRPGSQSTGAPEKTTVVR